MRKNDIFYHPHPTIETEEAQEKAIEIALESSRTGEDLDERELFFAMHVCAFLANKETEEIENWIERWTEIRECITSKNIGLVYKMIERFDGQEDDMISDAMYALSNCVKKFNPWKGYRFSSYACRAITNVLARWYTTKMKYCKRFILEGQFCANSGSRFMAGEDKLISGETGKYSDDYAKEERVKAIVETNSANLSSTEMFVIQERFYRGDNQETMPAIAAQLKTNGATHNSNKNIVFQIQKRAIEKIRDAFIAQDFLEKQSIMIG